MCIYIYSKGLGHNICINSYIYIINCCQWALETRPSIARSTQLATCPECIYIYSPCMHYMNMVWCEMVHRTRWLHVTCICVYIYPYVSIYIYISIYIHINISIYTRYNIHNYIHVYLWVCTLFLYFCYTSSGRVDRSHEVAFVTDALLISVGGSELGA